MWRNKVRAVELEKAPRAPGSREFTARRGTSLYTLYVDLLVWVVKRCVRFWLSYRDDRFCVLTWNL